MSLKLQINLKSFLKRFSQSVVVLPLNLKEYRITNRKSENFKITPKLLSKLESLKHNSKNIPEKKKWLVTLDLDLSEKDIGRQQ